MKGAKHTTLSDRARRKVIRISHIVAGTAPGLIPGQSYPANGEYHLALWKNGVVSDKTAKGTNYSGAFQGLRGDSWGATRWTEAHTVLKAGKVIPGKWRVTVSYHDNDGQPVVISVLPKTWLAVVTTWLAVVATWGE